MTLSVVIPTLNEAAELPETLRRAQAIPEVREIIVSDGGSTDETTAQAAAGGTTVVHGARGRGSQLRLGAERAKGEVVVLLHADTWLPADAGMAIRAALRPRDVVGGAFSKAFRDPPWLTWGSEFRCRLRMRWFQFAYADQAIFVRREVLTGLGGVPDVPLMEEYYLCTALRRAGRLALARATVTTSARRFREQGVLRSYWRLACLKLRHRLGATPEDLRRLYERR